MTEVVGEFETVVRLFPTQWFQFAPFWPADSVSVEAQRTACSDTSEPLRARR
jgi:hypothetical protein